MKDRLILLVVLASQISGCSARSPSVNIFGAYFPDWLFCISGGCLASAAIYMILTKLGEHMWLTPFILTYPLLIVLFSTGFWILFFY
ncbi:MULTISPECIES: YtcA family lipoprotein [Enterobacter]|uniref:YtcA family lipoprotein n=1 Tax=Enterobacter TaxID=547 RepID=UPI0039766260|nr:YtcA family lipoprotein [Klebsiella sp. T2.Ur]MCL6723244.1 YtcA family lipoprotein [Klebsiella sp. T2.Ur]